MQNLLGTIGSSQAGTNAAQITAVKASPGTYQKVQDDIIMRDEQAGAQKAQKNRDSKPQDVYGAQQQSAPAQRQDDPATQQPEETLSMCRDSAQGGVAGILEGFGLLTAEGSAQTDEEWLMLPEWMPEEVAEKLTLLPEEGQEPLDPLDAQVLAADANDPVQEAPREGAFARLLGHLDSLENPNNVPQDAVNQAADAQPTERDALYDLLANAQMDGVKRMEAAPQTGEAGVDLAQDESSMEVFFSQQPTERAAPVQGTFGAEEAALEQPVSAQDMEANVASIVDKITAATVNGQKEFQINLKPDFLGDLTIKLVMDGDSIKAQIKASDLAVKGLIQAELPGLQDQLRDRGLMVTQIEVSYEASAFDFNSQQHRHSGYQPTQDSGAPQIYFGNAAQADAERGERYEQTMTLPVLMGAGYEDLPANSSVQFTA